MKKYNLYNKVVLPLCVAVAGVLSSCSAFDDFLTVYPTNQITGEQFWEDKSDLESVVFACYKQMNSEAMNKRMLLWGEARSDNFIPRSASDQNLVDLMNANLLPTNGWFNWASFYQEIGYCNLVLSKGEEIVQKDNSFSEGDWLPIQAEVKTLRAIAYFYLVRAFRDVPFRITSSDTSVGVRDPQGQTSSEEILTFLINDLESVKDNGMTNYGNEVDNHGRITKNAIYTVLADLYLWRASKNSSTDSIKVYGEQYKEDYQKCIECCNYVIEAMNYRFNERGQEHYGKNSTEYPELPLLLPETRGQMTDVPYNEVFGSKNSLESIFEVGFSTGTSCNSAVDKYLGSYSSGSYSSGDMAPTSSLLDFADNTLSAGFYKTDIRAAQTFKTVSGGGASLSNEITKFIATSITINEPSDLTKKNAASYGGNRIHNYMDANYILYRASDVILMKAEAIAALLTNKESNPDEYQEAYDMVYAVFSRSNPNILQKDIPDISNFDTKDDLVDFIFNERQREFFCEGKRWFDLVRLAYKTGKTSSILNILSVKFTSNASAVKAKMATMNSLFSPVYKNEMKVNPALIQNPAWPDNETSERN